MFIVIPCRNCPNKHDDHLQCDGCQANFSLAASVNTYKDGERRRHEEPFKFCPLCGKSARKE
jgi:hypothetical protein